MCDLSNILLTKCYHSALYLLLYKAEKLNHKTLYYQLGILNTQKVAMIQKENFKNVNTIKISTYTLSVISSHPFIVNLI